MRIAHAMSLSAPIRYAYSAQNQRGSDTQSTRRLNDQANRNSKCLLGRLIAGSREERQQLLTVGRVPDADFAVEGTSSQQLALGMHREGVHKVAVAAIGAHRRTVGRFELSG